MGLIYKITNKCNNKIYIGKTIYTLDTRWYQHKNNAFNNNSPSYNYKFYKAIRKYGIENFNIEIIEEIDNSKLNEREQYWIKYFNSVDDGYNTTYGGEGCILYTDEQLLNLWEQGLCCAEIAKVFGHKYSTLYSKRLQLLGISEKEIIKRSRSKINRNSRKTVLQYSLNDEYIAKFESSIDVEKKLGFQSSNIRAACRGVLKTAYGYKWKYQEKQGG